MSHARLIRVIFLIGVGSMLAALFDVSVTSANNDYTSLLRSAFYFTVASAVTLAMVAVLGTARWRLFAVLSALPLISVIMELWRRGGFG